MSGIVGYLGKAQEDVVLQSMLRKMAQRSPGREGYHSHEPFFMAQRVPENAGGDGAPFYNESRQIAVVFSGQLCNAAEIRAKLEKKADLRGEGGDAALVLRLYEQFGVNCTSHMRGAFVFALHDVERNLAFIARDHMGAKPLYYTTATSGTFIFATEIKALLEHPAVETVPDLLGVDAYLSLGYMPGPDSLFKGVHELKPGHRVTWNPGLHVMIEPYWSWESFTTHDPALKTDADFQERFNTLFDEAVALRQAGNSRIGAFGRSSLEAAALMSSMAQNISGPLNVYAPLEETAAVTDGLPPVSDIAKRLGGHLEEVDGAAGGEQLPQLVWALDEPVADLGVLTRHLLARAAAPDVDGILSFTGADALFVSYPAQEMLLYTTQLRRSRFTMLSKMRGMVPVNTIARIFGYNGTIGPRTRQKLFDVLDSLRRDPLHTQFSTLFSLFDWRDKQPLYKGEMVGMMNTFVDMQRPVEGWDGPAMQLMAMQRDHWLPDAVLAPFDKLTGFNGLPGQLPFMDHALFEFMLGIPDRLRRTAGRRKSLLRGYVDKALPGIVNPLPVKQVRREQLRRKSQLETMLSVNPLREMVEACLSESSVRRRGLFHWSAVRNIIDQSRSGEIIYLRQLFTLLTLELWFRIYVDHERGWISG
ncbi:MAG: hypothetical protein GC185_09465 [Alphaproteobacteria bacterium]|nr:hypothetical protein [Alphaproteobacteria bacterium]